MTTNDPRPDYRALAESNADEAAFRLANGDGADVLPAAAVSLAANGTALVAEVHELRLTLEAAVDVLREVAAHLTRSAVEPILSEDELDRRRAARDADADAALDRLERRLNLPRQEGQA